MDKETLLKIVNKLQRESYISPYFVSTTKNPKEETTDKSSERRKKFYNLPENIQDKFLSEETSKKIQEIGRIYNLELLQLADISRAIRSYYFGEIQLQDFPQILSKEMTIDIATAQKISEIIIQKIINDNSQEKAYQAQLEKLTLAVAIEKFPDLGEQLITSNHIKLKNFPEPVRPSINNWLSDYTFSLGFESHSAIDRGTYLFRNENAKVLNSTDREKISYILKAYDENSLVDVNVNTKQIVFPKHEARINEQRTMNNDQKTIVNEQRTINNNQQARINTPQFQAPQRNIQEVYPHTNNIQDTKTNSNSFIYEKYTKPQTNQVGVGVYNSQKQETKPKDIFREERIATENRNAGNINFSSPQRMPYEKQTIQPIQPQKPIPNPQPLRISSQNFRNSTESTPKPRVNPTNVPTGNIVNLKDQ